jgi:hypothetical protein
MNKLEITIYNLVKNNPVLKQRIVDLYQTTLGLVPQKRLVSNLPIVTRQGYFFGFHDKSPFSADGKALLAHRNLIGNRRVRSGDVAEIGVFTGPSWTDFQPLGYTVGWNWQLGSMLQWFGVSSDCIIYNTLVSGRAVAVVQGRDAKLRAQWPYPVAHVSPNGLYACSYDFFRVEAAMPGYGIVMDQSPHGNDHDNHFRIFSTRDCAVTFELSMTEATAISNQPSMVGAFHFFHHALFNPTSQRVFFLHRWVDANQRRWTRMFSVGVDGSDLYLFPMDEMVSHITWASASEVFAYLRFPGQGDGYYLVKDRTGEARRYFADVLNSDGHPTMDPQRGIVITDTYPDRFRNQFLVLGLPESGQRIDLCRTHLPAIFKRELQVDLHPRLHPYLNIACIDSGHSGVRSLLTVDFSAVER